MNSFPHLLCHGTELQDAARTILLLDNASLTGTSLLHQQKDSSFLYSTISTQAQEKCCFKAVPIEQADNSSCSHLLCLYGTELRDGITPLFFAKAIGTLSKASAQGRGRFCEASHLHNRKRHTSLRLRHWHRTY